MYRSDLHTSRGAFSVTCKFGAIGFSLEERIHAELCHRLKVFLGILGGSWGGDWASCIAWCEVFYSEESPRASELLYPAERGGAFLREPAAIAAKLGNCSN